MSADRFVVLTLAFHKEGRQWVGECLELGTATNARSLERAQAELIEFVELKLEGLQEAGELDYFFEKYHIPLYRELPRAITPTVPVDEDRLLRVQSFALPRAA